MPTMNLGQPSAETVALYRKLFEAVHAAARENEDLPPTIAIEALVNYAADIAIASGTLPGLIDSLRDLIDYLERRRESEEPEPLRATLRETLAASIRPVAH